MSSPSIESKPVAPVVEGPVAQDNQVSVEAPKNKSVSDSPQLSSNNKKLDTFKRVFKGGFRLGPTGINYGNSSDPTNSDGKTRLQWGFGARFDAGAHGSVLNGRVHLGATAALGFDVTNASQFDNKLRNFYAGLSPSLLFNLYRAEHKNGDASPFLIGGSALVAVNRNWAKGDAVIGNMPVNDFASTGMRIGGCAEVVPPFAYGLKLSLCGEKIFQKTVDVSNPFAGEQAANATSLTVGVGGNVDTILLRKIGGNPKAFKRVTGRDVAGYIAGASDAELKTLDEMIKGLLFERGDFDLASSEASKSEVAKGFDPKYFISIINEAKSESKSLAEANESIYTNIQKTLEADSLKGVKKELSKRENNGELDHKDDVKTSLENVRLAEASLVEAKKALETLSKYQELQDSLEGAAKVSKEEVEGAKLALSEIEKNVESARENSAWTQSSKVVEQYKEVWSLDAEVEKIILNFKTMQTNILYKITTNGQIDLAEVDFKDSLSASLNNIKQSRDETISSVASFNGECQQLLKKYQSWAEKGNTRQQKLARTFIPQIKELQERAQSIAEGAKIIYKSLVTLDKFEGEWKEGRNLAQQINHFNNKNEDTITIEDIDWTHPDAREKIKKINIELQKASVELVAFNKEFETTCKEGCETLRKADFSELAAYSQRVVDAFNIYKLQDDMINHVIDIKMHGIAANGDFRAKNKENLAQMRELSQLAFIEALKTFKEAKLILQVKESDSEDAKDYKSKKAKQFDKLYEFTLNMYRNVADLHYRLKGNRNDKRREQKVQEDLSYLMKGQYTPDVAKSIAMANGTYQPDEGSMAASSENVPANSGTGETEPVEME